MIAEPPWTGAPVRNAERDDLRGSGFARHLNIGEGQPATAGRARAIDHVIHRTADIIDVVGFEIVGLRGDQRIIHQQSRIDPHSGREPRGHHRQLQRAGEVIALTDRGVDRVEWLPFAPEFVEFPIGIGDRAVKLAGHGQVKFLPQAHIAGHFGDFVEPDLLGKMVIIAVAGLIDRLGHIDRAVIAPTIEKAIANTPPAAA